MFLPTSREAWQEVVNKMITAYKAPVSPDDAKTIVDYLVRTKGHGLSNSILAPSNFHESDSP